jgi:hypothetical protein
MRTKILCALLVCCTSVYSQKRLSNEFHVEQLNRNVFAITEVLFHDVVNPPAAARFYAYSMLTAQHITSENFETFVPPGFIKNYPIVISEVQNRYIEPHFAALFGMLETAKHIIPSGSSLADKQTELVKNYLKAGVKRNVIDSSKVYATSIASKVVEFSKSDGYLKLSTMTRYQPANLDSTWFPTPPEYMGAVEPHWNTVRTFLLDSADQFSPGYPVRFNSDPESDFYKLMKEVYDVSKILTNEQRSIANYWDCNPFANFYSGHVNVAIKKISPGGHWMSITGIACKKSEIEFAKAITTYSMVAMTLHDGFISCWDEKYKSQRVRPKTAINKFVDEHWNPVLETPPFPEYTSGHSVISSAVAEVLTAVFGDGFAFTDNTEVMFGIPERNFSSFRQAADEASVSRLYGGIHFRDAITNGQEQGKNIGLFVAQKLKGSF